MDEKPPVVYGTKPRRNGFFLRIPIPSKNAIVLSGISVVSFLFIIPGWIFQPRVMDWVCAWFPEMTGWSAAETKAGFGIVSLVLGFTFFLVFLFFGMFRGVEGYWPWNKNK